MAEDSSPTDKSAQPPVQPNADQVAVARNDLVASLIDQVVAGAEARLNVAAPALQQPSASAQVVQPEPPVPRLPASPLPVLRDHNYAAQVSFNTRILEFLVDPVLDTSPAVQRAVVLLRRRIAALIAGNSDFAVFEELNKFEKSEGIEATLDDGFAAVLRERAKAAACEKRSSAGRREGAPAYKKQRFGGASSVGPASFGGGPQLFQRAAFPFLPFPGFPPVPGPFQQPGGGFQPSSAKNCFVRSAPGHRARNCPNAANNKRRQ